MKTSATTGRPRASCSTAPARCSRATDDALIDLVRRGQGVLNIVPLGQVVQELDARIDELSDTGTGG